MSVRLALTTVAVGLALCGCDRSNKRDCNGAAKTLYLLGPVMTQVPKKQEELPAILKPIDDALAEWERAKSEVTTVATKSWGDEYAGLVRARRKLLEHAFDPVPAAPHPSASPPAPATTAADDSPDARRKAALAAAAQAAFNQMVPTQTQPPNREALGANQQAAEEVRLRLFDICSKDMVL